ncbi:MAG: hypothetical protein K2O12_02615 [Muribaculaceae bacterium]|nr:hypothetical protein [Muribaculaceae bacterium]
MESLKYIDEEDKAYGLAGMSVAAVIWDEIEAISSISLDDEDESSLEFASDYVYSAPAGISVKNVWQHAFMHYRLCVRLLLSNVACRTMVRQRTDVPDKTVRMMKSMISEEGQRQCSLENDEAEMVFKKNYNDVCRIFNHSAVRQIADEFVADLKECRRMTAADIIDRLGRLRMM